MSRSCQHSGTALATRSAIQVPRFYLRLLAKHPEVLRSHLWTTPISPHSQNQCSQYDGPSLAPPLQRCDQLEELLLALRGVSFLNHFAFRNLTTFEFTAASGGFPISQLLNFLEALPTLQTVRMKIGTEVLRGDVPPQRVIVLPNIEIFSVTEGGLGYGIAPYISCPSARRMALVREHNADDLMSEEIFPAWTQSALSIWRAQSTDSH